MEVEGVSEEMFDGWLDADGFAEDCDVGCPDSWEEGLLLGFLDGMLLSWPEGCSDGMSLGWPKGWPLGYSEG